MYCRIQKGNAFPACPYARFPLVACLIRFTVVVYHFLAHRYCLSYVRSMVLYPKCGSTVETL
ncbi:hypothetical protein K431DRAFT_140316 [Polychaeton citri CBS 116435]|uniref:Uncharacterized protein n=1 Tax=Polychaeton citri CBS 116435 TaxID=1314669 RepID=A0A9P4Q060_9PEZI|nr:hypothetical protein K431DRAFT_140316 [Polychaeton citri CBS 116435]